jgi:hypothetical protein
MEILRFLLSFLLKEVGGDKLTPILETFKNNDFDLKKTLSNLNLEKIAPIISAFFQMNAQKNRPTESAERNFYLSPIAGIADKDIIYTLNKYFSR